MKVNRFPTLKAYAAENHFDMHCLRVQGQEASPAQSSWMGMSWLLPGGHTSLSPSPVEKIYLVLEGSLSLSNGTEEATLEKYDSCFFAPGEKRQLVNKSNFPAAVLLVMPFGANALSTRAGPGDR